MSETKPNPFQRDFDDQSLRSLYRKMKKTAMARFECATRMRRHQKFSLWSISIFSAGLIIFPLLHAFGVPTYISTGWLNVMQVVMALMVLVLSLLISANNVGDKAEKMHKCGLELNALCHEALPHCRAELCDVALYESFRGRYSQILNVYENHEDLDFDRVQMKLGEVSPKHWYSHGLIVIRTWLNYWVYYILMAVLVAALYVTLIE